LKTKVKNNINSDLLQSGKKKEVEAELAARIAEYNGSSDQSAMQVLIEIQLYMTRLNTIEQETVERRGLLLEWLVIALILIEAVIGAWELRLGYTERAESSAAVEIMKNEISGLRSAIVNTATNQQTGQAAPSSGSTKKN